MHAKNTPESPYSSLGGGRQKALDYLILTYSAPQLLKPIEGFDGVDSTCKEEGGHESGCEIMYL